MRSATGEGEKQSEARMPADAEIAESLLRGAVRAGVDVCVYLPDSCLTSTVRAFQRSEKITTIACAREDEGVAIAVGFGLAGRIALCFMEASGIGLSALILARAKVQRTPVVIIASHTGGAGEPHDYHGATVLLAEGIFTGLGIPYEIATAPESLESLMYRVVQTARGQLAPFGLLIPPFIASGASA
jgi:sulfopyruvate decarboxylase TPP-binding subunit